MGLIKCDECGNEVSDKAESCPRCGAPVTSIVSREPIRVRTEADEINDPGDLLIAGLALLYMGLAGGIGWKFFGKIGFYVGAGLAFSSCLFNKEFREGLFALIVAISAFGAIGYLIYWIIS